MTAAELELFRLLADGAYHSGEEIGALLGISRAAVWKRVNALEKSCGVQVSRVAGKGYSIEGGVEFLCTDSIRQLMQQTISLSLHQQVDSTNEQAKKAALPGGQPIVFLAEQQTEGRGRRGRAWHSPYACNLYLSLCWPLTTGMQEVEALSLVVGLVVRNALDDVGVKEAGLKWPNDVLVGERKIAGVLLELVGDPADQGFVIIGIGVNVNMAGDQAAIDQAWTSVRDVVGRPVSRNQLAAQLLDRLLPVLVKHREQGFIAYKDEWQKHHLWQDSHVRLCSGRTTVEGRVLGLTDKGGLIVDSIEGEQAFYGGELSLRLSNGS